MLAQMKRREAKNEVMLEETTNLPDNLKFSAAGQDVGATAASRIACDRCGVFHCVRCARKKGERYLCRGCESRAFELDRDLAVEGHVQAIANYNFLVATGGVVAMLFASRHPLLAGSPLGIPLALAAAFFFGTLPPWLGINLRRRWAVARHLQILLAAG